MTPCSAAGIFENPTTTSGYIECTFVEEVITCPEGMFYNPEKLGCFYRGCSAPTETKDCKFTPGSVIGSQKFAAESCFDYKSCVNVTDLTNTGSKVGTISLCTFPCEPDAADKNYAFSATHSDCIQSATTNECGVRNQKLH